MIGLLPLLLTSTPVALLPVSGTEIQTKVRPALSWECSFELDLPKGSHGVGLVWGKPNKKPTMPWDEPNIPDGLGIGFDSWNPPSKDWFDANGNIDEKPEHEVSVHWNGREVANVFSPADFRTPHSRVAVKVDFEVGGAAVSVAVNGQPALDHLFVPGVQAFPATLWAGQAEGPSSASLSNLKLRERGTALPVMKPTEVKPFERVITDSGHHEQSAAAEFPADTRSFGRITCELDLSKPDVGFDPWDRMACVTLTGDDGREYEVVRYITPYHRGHTWEVDVSDLRPLLTGRRKMKVWCETYGPGWLVSVNFRFWPGKAGMVASKVVPLWDGRPEIGNPEKPATDFFKSIAYTRPRDVDQVKIRTTVTGHGMEPNTNNAGEFMPLGRTLKVGATAFKNLLWKDDCYLNPCRPQGGSWKFSRAGWAPGDVVRPWVVDVTAAAPRGVSTPIDYKLDPYLNEGRGKTWAPFHWVHSVLVEFRKVR